MIQNKNFDVVVVGLGAMGSSASYHLALAGQKVLGIEQYTCAHSKGSSHGETRLIRQAYFEHPDYVPLLQESYSLWRDLEEKSGKKLLHQTGVVIIGDPKTSTVLKGVQDSAAQFQIPIEKWSPEKISQKHPALKVPPNCMGLYEPTGGYLEVEKCVQTFCEEAEKRGAQLHFEEPLLSFEKTKEGFRFQTAKGTYFGQKCIFTCGAWTSKWILESKDWLSVHRAPLFWFSANELFHSRAPCFAYDLKEGFFYGFTEKNGLVKLALHQPLEKVKDPSNENREISHEEGRLVREFVRKYLHQVCDEPQRSELCFYTMSPDQHFIIDEVKDLPGAFWAGGFSGHGFKFSSLIGKVLAEKITQGRTRFPVEFLSSQRLLKK